MSLHCRPPVQVGKVHVVQQQGRLGIHKEEERAYKVFSPHTLLVKDMTKAMRKIEEKIEEEEEI